MHGSAQIYFYCFSTEKNHVGGLGNWQKKITNSIIIFQGACQQLAALFTKYGSVQQGTVV
jgi:hypothetical protein